MKRHLAAGVLAILIFGLQLSAVCEPIPRSTDGSQADAKSSKCINKDEATAIARKFVDLIPNVSSKKMEYRGISRDAYPPYTDCHMFEIPLNAEHEPDVILIDDPKAPHGYRRKTVPGPKTRAWLLVEAQSGRILCYSPDVWYPRIKNNKKPAPKKEELIPEKELIRVAENYIKQAGVSTEGMKLVSSELDTTRAQDKYYGYWLCWKRFVELSGIGSVEHPDAIMVYIDAQTGELDDFLYKEHSVKQDWAPLKVSKKRAEKIARDIAKPDKIDTIDTQLLLYFNCLDPKKPVVLAWEVMFNERSEHGRCGAMIDAYTGKVITWSDDGAI